jgi:hypothetical protein
MSRCPGCYPHFQANQLAHMEPGGCMYVEDMEEISMISEATSLPSVHVMDVSTEEECCICYENIGIKNNCVTECGHKFCFKCLAMSMTRSNACPCCRQPLTDEPELVDEEDESDYEESVDEGDSDEEDDDEISLVPIEIIAERLVKNGFTMLDMVAMFMGANAGDASEKYSPLQMDALYAKCDNIVDEARKEAEETAMFAAEDTRA